MKEKPLLGILNREEAHALVTVHYEKQTALLRDLADYGSNLVVRAFESSTKKMAEVVVCGVLLKQVVAMIDATEVLLSAGCGLAAFLPARAAFEASIYADWILKEDSERRATRYVVGNYRDERLWATRAIPGTIEEQAMTRVTELLGYNLHAKRPEVAPEAAKRLAEINRILEQQDLKNIDQEYDKARGKRPRDPEWYQLDGLASIRQVAERVGRLPEYEFFYSRGSQVTHTGSYKDHVRFVSQQIRFVPIRHLADVNMLLNFTCSIAIGAYQKIVERYRPGEIPAFSKKYIEDWRDPYQNIQGLKYDF